MADLFQPTIADLIACAERELRMRRKVYPRWVSAGNMTQEKAAREIDLMERIVKALTRFSHIERAAQAVIHETNAISEEPWPIKYRAPYAAITQLIKAME